DLIVRTATLTTTHPFDRSKVALTYLIPIPYALFVRELLGPGWKKTISIWVWAQIAFALLALPMAGIGGQLYWTDLLNGYMVIGGTALTVLHLVLQKTQETAARGLKWPLIVFAALVILTNGGFTIAGQNIEPVGFLVLLSGLGFTAARRAIRREQKLNEVEQELATSRRIQSSILPRDWPRVPALQIAVRYEPMTAVAGDFYDCLRTGENSVTILVADVSGHGVPAALVASMLKIC